ncbi:MAG: hypothetical protein WDM85_01805 [Caulobacteraceae bacterium]
MALASAYQSTGNAQHAAEVIRHIWRAKPFDVGAQQTMMSRFSSVLTADDYAAREDMLLYGTQGDASRALLAYLSPDQKLLAQARMAIRQGGVTGQVPDSLKDSPGVAYELALAAQRRGDTSGALALIPRLPTALPDQDGQSRMWKLRKQLVIAALKAGDTRGAYKAAAFSGCDQGADGAEAEFYAGWLALSRMHDAKLARPAFRPAAGHRRLADHRQPRALLARSGGRGDGRSGGGAAVLRRRRPLPDRLLRPAGCRQGRPHHARTRQGP